MLFTQPEFLIFFLVVFGLSWVSKSNVWRKLILLLASYYFYAYWDYRFLSLILISTFIDYFLALQIASSETASRKKLLVTCSIVTNLTILGFFKYFNFFIESAYPILNSVGLNPSTLNVVLPIGISFYTFQTLSYTIDVYRGRLEARKSLLDVALYVAFFPQLVAGPIVRASELLPQFELLPKWNSRRLYDGGQQFLRGAIKKVLVADHLAFAVDEIFANTEIYSGGTVWLGAIAYAGQIYCDFSGYSDMAIGLAKTLGYDFCENFNHPYNAKSIQEFWRRWHISLSSWLRDYLYIPLGGNRKGEGRTYVNLLLTMTLGGLWHGAAWTFVAWGLLHGLALSLHRFLLAKLFRANSFLLALGGWTATMLVVLVGWVLFRATSFGSATIVLEKMFLFESGVNWFPPIVVLLLLLLAIEHIIVLYDKNFFELAPEKWYSPFVTTLMIWCLILYPPVEFRPFVYFQF